MIIFAIVFEEHCVFTQKETVGFRGLIRQNFLFLGKLYSGNKLPEVLSGGQKPL